MEATHGAYDSTESIVKWLLSVRILGENSLLVCNNLLGPSGIGTLFLFKNVYVWYIEDVVLCDNL